MSDMQPEWEGYADDTQRLKVQGGYLYNLQFPFITGEGTQTLISNMCFVPDSDKCQFHDEHEPSATDIMHQAFKYQTAYEKLCAKITSDVLKELREDDSRLPTANAKQQREYAE